MRSYHLTMIRQIKQMCDSADVESTNNWKTIAKLKQLLQAGGMPFHYLPAILGSITIEIGEDVDVDDPEFQEMLVAFTQALVQIRASFYTLFGQNPETCIDYVEQGFVNSARSWSLKIE